MISNNPKGKTNMLPYLLYNTELKCSLLSENRQFRNAGDLLVTSCPSVINTIRLCGADENILANGSDYDRFTALCYSIPYLEGHPVKNGINKLVTEVLGFYEPLSPYNVDEAWYTINEFIEENNVTPLSLLASINVESICYPIDPFSEPATIKNDVDVYTILDLNNIISQIKSPNNSCNTLDEFIGKLKDSEMHSSIRISLDNNYFFARNSKKYELQNCYCNIKSNKDVSLVDINSIITSIIVEIAGTPSISCKPVIISVKCPVSELNNLYSYLKLNNILPNNTIINCPISPELENFIIEYVHRNPYGIPSIVPVSQNYKELSRIYPIGFAIKSADNITDIVKIAAYISESQSLAELYDEEICENITYVNIKNRFQI